MYEYEKILLTFLTIINQVKIYHWQTLSYSRHITSGNLYSQLDKIIDKFIEALQGRIILENNNPHFRILLNDKMNSIILKNYSDGDAFMLIFNIKTYLESDELISTISKYTDLVTLKDEMLTIINNSGYLFSL